MGVPGKTAEGSSGQPSKNKFSDSQRTAIKFGLSAVAATVAESVTYPLDLTKTRLQVQGEAMKMKDTGVKVKGVSVAHPMVHKRGMLTMAGSIVKEEGLLKLWQGLKPAVCRHIVYTGSRMGVYELIREHGFGKRPDGSFPVWKSILTGLSAGGISQLLASPMDLVKVRMQTEGRRRLEGHAPRVRSMSHALTTIYKQGGMRGLWSGWGPNVQRAALVNMGDLTTYDSVKRYILQNTSLKDNYVTHFLSSLCSGMVAAIVSTPADVVKTRIMNQPTGSDGRGLYYKSSYNCLVKTVKEEGFFALYKGFVPLYIRMAPWSLVFWLSYERIRLITGVGGF